MSDPATPAAPPGGVIHDIGYRAYDGPRESNGRIALSLFVTSLRHAYGLGRSGRSKVLPVLLGVLTLLPAAIMVGVVAIVGFDSQVMSYTAYTSTLQVPISVFAAAQAPVIFSRDLRSRSIVLYLARPLSAAAFTLTRWAAWVTALLIFILAPHVVLFGGALLNGLDVSDELELLGKSLPLSLLLALLLGSISALVSSIALRRGFGVVGTILVVLVSNLAVQMVQGVAYTTDHPRVGELAAMFSPWSLVNGLGAYMDAGNNVITPPDGAGTVTLLVVVALVVVALLVLGLVRRFRKAGR
ncbi:ABC transporter permease [Nocardioides jishulii]|uniref:ABC transporter permease n=1 Tax=Nocardioides jishulii TaxID=2575440 RepID=A0A4U2YTC0_9ACTN|nr:ABC transporter permease [Nocardioides jishulii]QCX28331.1 ABC transporter permease [Nocardioides jishulii]TKI64776.1 ABC transporter permease [Nocardioides jishulii]